MFDLRRPNSTTQVSPSENHPPIIHHHAVIEGLDNDNDIRTIDLAFVKAGDAFEAIHAWPDTLASRSNYMCASTLCDPIKSLADMPNGKIKASDL